MNRRRLPEVPAGLTEETTQLLITLEATVINLRQFTERLRVATAEQSEGTDDDA